MSRVLLGPKLRIICYLLSSLFLYTSDLEKKRCEFICWLGRCQLWNLLSGGSRPACFCITPTIGEAFCFPHDQTPRFNSWFLPSLPLNLPSSFHYPFSFHILSFWDLFFFFLSLSLSSFLLAVCSIQPFQSESSQSLRKGSLCRALSPGFLVEQLRYCPLYWGDAGFCDIKQKLKVLIAVLLAWLELFRKKMKNKPRWVGSIVEVTWKLGVLPAALLKAKSSHFASVHWKESSLVPF